MAHSSQSQGKQTIVYETDADVCKAVVVRFMRQYLHIILPIASSKTRHFFIIDVKQFGLLHHSRPSDEYYDTAKLRLASFDAIQKNESVAEFDCILKSMVSYANHLHDRHEMIFFMFVFERDQVDAVCAHQTPSSDLRTPSNHTNQFCHFLALSPKHFLSLSAAKGKIKHATSEDIQRAVAHQRLFRDYTLAHDECQQSISALVRDELTLKEIDLVVGTCQHILGSYYHSFLSHGQAESVLQALQHNQSTNLTSETSTNQLYMYVGTFEKLDSQLLQAFALSEKIYPHYVYGFMQAITALDASMAVLLHDTPKKLNANWLDASSSSSSSLSSSPSLFYENYTNTAHRLILLRSTQQNVSTAVWKNYKIALDGILTEQYIGDKADEVKHEVHKHYECNGYIFGYMVIVCHPTEPILFILDTFIQENLRTNKKITQMYTAIVDSLCRDENMQHVIVMQPANMHYTDLYDTLFCVQNGFNSKKQILSPFIHDLSKRHNWNNVPSHAAVQKTPTIFAYKQL